tara:strand:+ start:2012 stop:2167 length:156 start_codon:yes stop_codon:yes gene_type:complete
MDAKTIARVFDKNTIEKALDMVEEKEKQKNSIAKKLRGKKDDARTINTIYS